MDRALVIDIANAAAKTPHQALDEIQDMVDRKQDGEPLQESCCVTRWRWSTS
jgi:hypothetical protein